MSYPFYRIELAGLCSLLVGCAYPALRMGEGAGGTSSSTDEGSGGTTGSGGAATTMPGNGGAVVTSPGNGGATTTVTAKGGSVGSGGTVTTSPGSGGAVTTATTVASAGAPSVPCTTSTNLIASALASGGWNNWIGGDDTTAADNPCGVQGAIYVYSDNGLDGIVGGADATVQIPALDTTSTIVGARLTPCSNGKCCFSGTTTKWPINGTTIDTTASVWGGGLGLNLNTDASDTRFPYPGPATGFNFTLSGTLSGHEVRLRYLQNANDVASPFKTITLLGTISLPFAGVACAEWDTACVSPPTAHPYGLEVQIVGGNTAGAYSLCIESITPILP